MKLTVDFHLQTELYTLTLKSQIEDLNGGKDLNCGFPDHDTQSGSCLSMFWSNILPPSSGQNIKDTGNHLQHRMS